MSRRTAPFCFCKRCVSDSRHSPGVAWALWPVQPCMAVQPTRVPALPSAHPPLQAIEHGGHLHWVRGCGCGCACSLKRACAAASSSGGCAALNAAPVPTCRACSTPTSFTPRCRRTAPTGLSCTTARCEEMKTAGRAAARGGLAGALIDRSARCRSAGRRWTLRLRAPTRALRASCTSTPSRVGRGWAETFS